MSFVYPEDTEMLRVMIAFDGLEGLELTSLRMSAFESVDSRVTVTVERNQESLIEDMRWLPGADRLLAAFRRDLSGVRYLLIGESPYPRPESANPSQPSATPDTPPPRR